MTMWTQEDRSLIAHEISHCVAASVRQHIPVILIRPDADNGDGSGSGAISQYIDPEKMVRGEEMHVPVDTAIVCAGPMMALLTDERCGVDAASLLAAGAGSLAIVMALGVAPHDLSYLRANPTTPAKLNSACRTGLLLSTWLKESGALDELIDAILSGRQALFDGIALGQACSAVASKLEVLAGAAGLFKDEMSIQSMLEDAAAAPAPDLVACLRGATVAAH
jgi:hypothetical protein